MNYDPFALTSEDYANLASGEPSEEAQPSGRGRRLAPAAVIASQPETSELPQPRSLIRIGSRRQTDEAEETRRPRGRGIVRGPSESQLPTAAPTRDRGRGRGRGAGNVNTGVRPIQAYDQQLDSFIEYFKNTWINGNFEKTY
jgi:hypothetical protein